MNYSFCIRTLCAVFIHMCHDIMPDLEYMDDTWPCTPIIKSRIGGMIDDARRKRQARS